MQRFGFLALGALVVIGIWVLSIHELERPLSAADWTSFRYGMKFDRPQIYVTGPKEPNSPIGRKPSLDPSPYRNVEGYYGAVSCDVEECSDMGVDILRKGGSAVDAAITVALCLGSVNAFSSGIGGGGFMTVRHPNGTALAYDFREIAPAKAHKHMFDQDPILAQVGGLAVAVPGELAGLEQAFGHFTSGKLSWKDLFDPVVDMNRRGFNVSIVLAYAIAMAQETFIHYPDEWEEYYLKDDKDGRLLVGAGDILTRPKYADTLEMIGRNGSSAIFYDPEGPIAPSIAAAAQARGGVLEASDFASYQSRVSVPLRTEFMGREVLVPGNPSSGPALLFALNVLDGFDSSEVSEGHDYDPLETHRLVETMKFMAAQRSRLGDVSDNQVHINRMLSHEWAEEIRKNISDSTTHDWTYYDPFYETPETHGTTHFSVIDKDNMAVSMTTTVNLLFGAQVADPRTGIVLNSEMDDFSVTNTSNWFGLAPSVYNYVEPGKRPLSSTCPAVVTDLETGIPEMIIGAAGGSHITTAVLQAIVRVLRYRLPLLETIAYPRMHHQLLPHKIFFESLVSDEIQEALRQKGHTIEHEEVKTAMNGIVQDPLTGKIQAVSDFWRKGGQAAAY